MPHSKSAAKEEIFKTAVVLFSKKGFSGVGLREISREAGVNLSMTSYYYNGKAGILKEIYEKYFDLFGSMVEDSLDVSRSIEDNIREFVKKTIAFFIKEPHLVRVVHREFPFDMPELNEVKVKNVTRLQKMAEKFIKHYNKEGKKENPYLYMVFSSLTITIFVNFQLKAVFTEIHNLSYDENFIEKYGEMVSSLFLHGFLSLQKSDL